MSFRTRFSWHKKVLRNVGSTPFLHWLCGRGSLTAQLQARGIFTVHLLHQGLGTPTLDEAATLGIKRKRIAWIREVALSCDEVPLVFAHTVLPYRPRGPMTHWLARLGNRSLGTLLFSQHSFERGALRFKQLDHRNVLFNPAIEALQLKTIQPECLWARRSSFKFRAQAILLTEIFSPALGAKAQLNHHKKRK